VATRGQRHHHVFGVGRALHAKATAHVAPSKNGDIVNLDITVIKDGFQW